MICHRDDRSCASDNTVFVRGGECYKTLYSLVMLFSVTLVVVIVTALPLLARNSCDRDGRREVEYASRGRKKSKERDELP
jgi:hypothetical protein